MKQLKIFVISACLPLVSMAGTSELDATADASLLRDEPNANKGVETAVWVFGGGPAGYHAGVTKAWLKFDASRVKGKVTDVDLVAVYTAKRDRSVMVYLLKSAPEWSENKITWANAPGNKPDSTHELADEAVLIGTMGGAGAGNEIALKFQDRAARNMLVEALNEGPRTVTLVLVQPPYSQSSIFTIASRESKDHPGPRLKLKVSGKP